MLPYHKQAVNPETLKATQMRILLRPINGLRMGSRGRLESDHAEICGQCAKRQSACRDAEAGYRSSRYLTEPCLQREGLLLPPSRELLDGRPQVLVLGAHALPPRDRHHHVVQAPALPDT